jgi:poly(hydroxyalkanoate) depolymerase family esterase
MIWRRIKVMDLLQRWKRALRQSWRRLPGAVTLDGEWRTGSYEDPAPRKLLARRAQIKLHYHLYLPGDRLKGERLPLLVMLHGCSQDGVAFAAGTRMNAIAQQHGCAVLYPEQSRTANAQRCWNWFDREAQRGHAEAGLIVGLVQDVMRREAVDVQRVYVAGMSAGAAMAEILALRFPGLFAASALHSGVMYAAADSAGEALRVMRSGASLSPTALARRLAADFGQEVMLAPALVIHGRADATVNPRNAEQIVAQRLALAGMTGADGQPIAPTEELNFEIGGRNILQRDYARNGTLVVRMLLVEGLGHAWSGGTAQENFNDPAGPDASLMIMQFLRGHRLAAQSPLPALVTAPTATG